MERTEIDEPGYDNRALFQLIPKRFKDNEIKNFSKSRNWYVIESKKT